RKLAELGEPRLAFKASIAQLMALQAKISGGIDKFKDYAAVVSSLDASLKANDLLIADASELLRFNPYLFRYGTMGLGSPEEVTAALEATEALLNHLLAMVPDHNNWIEQRGVTRLYLGLTAALDAMDAVKKSDASETEKLREATRRNLVAAIEDL